MTPSPIQVLSYLAGRTKIADVGSAVIVLPWQDPVRLTEQVAMMDIMLGGRLLFLGFGRGASADEFDGLRIPMSQSRARFAECLEIIRRGLKQVAPASASTRPTRTCRSGSWRGGTTCRGFSAAAARSALSPLCCTPAVATSPRSTATSPTQPVPRPAGQPRRRDKRGVTSHLTRSSR
jgi:alkanesulfonate monooxygenase SsuD/methylene tetrahydromethanopterin reductase-like flavin-dependent oxidoreductase (luciferase family)